MTDETNNLINRLKRAGIVFLTVILIGTFGYVFLVDDITWFDGLYMTFVTVTTIGFAEVINLEGNTPDTPGTGTWEIIGGMGTIESPNDPNTALSGLTIGENILQWNIDNGPCGTSTDTVSILIFDPDAAVADAGEDQTALCGVPAVLDGSASTPPAANITYQWIGTPTLGDVGAVSPEAIEAGSYQLVVTNINNSCADTSEVVTVTFEFPDDANAGADAAS